MKLKNYYYLIITLNLSIINVNAQKNNTQPKSSREMFGDVNFTTRIPGAIGGKLNVKGDIAMIGNTIIGRATTAPTFDAGNPIPTNLSILTAEANTPYNGSGKNNDFSFEYIDTDLDPTTFSSSSSDLNIKNLQGTNDGVQVAYAGLYWAGSYSFTRSTNPSVNNIGTPTSEDWNQVKLKLPTGNYIDITVDKNNANVDIAGQEDAVIVRDTPDPASSLTIGAPFVCYKNVISLIAGLGDGNANGTYTLANMRSGLGENLNGISSGWNLIIVYTHPSLPNRYVTIFDGYKSIQTGQPAIDINIAGFQTVTAPFSVKAKIGVAALEGDLGSLGDKVQISSPISSTIFTDINNANNPGNDFFNSTISIPTSTLPFSAINLDRNPNSSNTLGFDVDIVEIANPANSIIANDAIDAKIRFPSSFSDTYSVYLMTFSVEVTTNLANENFELKDLKYYPNPTSNILNISHSEMLTDIEVSNVLGQKLIIEKVNKNDCKLDLSGLPNATYFVKIKTIDKEKTVKILKQ